MTALAEGWGARRMLLSTTASLADGLAAQLAGELGGLWSGVFSAIAAHSPREA